MTVEFDFYKNPQPKDSKKQTRYHARVVSRGVIGTTELAKIIHSRCTLSVADVEAALIALGELTAEKLKEGRRVHIEGLGYFQMTLECPSVLTTTEIHAQSVSFKSVAFRAEKGLKTQLQLTKFERTQAKKHSVAYSDIEIDDILTSYFREHTYIMRRDFEQICFCTSWMAAKHIKRLVEESKLLKEGSSRSPLYRPAPGFYGMSGVADAEGAKL